jgi:RNA polymerase sigma-70 factor, ECF subfamily
MRPEMTPAQAIEQLYDEYHQPILRYLERLVRERETAEDLCQKTFLKALRHWG